MIKLPTLTCVRCNWTLKRGITGVYHQVSHKHLGRYVDEFAFRLNDGNVTCQDKEGKEAPAEREETEKMTGIKLQPWESHAIKVAGTEIAKQCFPPLKIKDIECCPCCNAPRDEWDYCDLCEGVSAYEVRR
jgi:hypothetical protein